MDRMSAGLFGAEVKFDRPFLFHWPERIPGDPDAIVVTGDIVQDKSRAGYQRFRETLQAFCLPVFCIPGITTIRFS